MMRLLEDSSSPAIQLAAVRTVLLMDALDEKWEREARYREAAAAALQMEAFRSCMAVEPAFWQRLASATRPVPTAVIPAAPPAAPPADDAADVERDEADGPPPDPADLAY